MRCASRPALTLATVQWIERLDRQIEEEVENERTAIGQSMAALFEVGKSRALIGEMLLTARARLTQEVGRGYFEDWYSERHGLPKTTANKYMRFAQNWSVLSGKLAELGKYEVASRLLSAAVHEDRCPVGHLESGAVDYDRLIKRTDLFLGRFEKIEVAAMPIEVKAQLRAKLEKLLEGLR
jgi:hypothetical protein